MTVDYIAYCSSFISITFPTENSNEYGGGTKYEEPTGEKSLRIIRFFFKRYKFRRIFIFVIYEKVIIHIDD